MVCINWGNSREGWKKEKKQNTKAMQGQTVGKAEEMTAFLSASWAVRKLIQYAGGLAWIHCSPESNPHLGYVFLTDSCSLKEESLPADFAYLLRIPNGCSIWFPSSLKQPIFKMLGKNLFSRKALLLWARSDPVMVMVSAVSEVTAHQTYIAHFW